jgi:hypothetical protein
MSRRQRWIHPLRWRLLQWQLPAALVMVGLLLGAGLSMGILQYVDGSPIGQNWNNAQETVLDTDNAMVVQAPRTVIVPDRYDLPGAAQLIEPLADLRTGDRVIYANTVCNWLSWGRSPESSRLHCDADGRPIEVATYRLTPVELKRS